jgi:gliding motility-associated-like protein
MKNYFLILFFLSAIKLFATHNRAGEISFCTDNGLTYYFTVTTYTEPYSCAPDRCELEINYGDGQKETIFRVNGNPCPIPASCGTSQGNCSNCGEMITPTLKKNVYTSVHTYSGAGTFVISMEDPNRNDGILNIPNSSNVLFYITNTLIINPFAGYNCNPTLTFPPIDNGCIGYPYQHNPGAVDPEGDSLAFSLIDCFMDGGQPISGYELPNVVPIIQGTIEINPYTGTLTWDSPKIQGEYNVCILIQEYRNGVLVGSMVRDMQITISSCPTNKPPVLEVETPLCVLAGETINSQITGSDPDFDFLTLSSEGEAYELLIKPAVFDSISQFGPINTSLTWETDCEHVRKNPYLFYFKLFDNGGIYGLSVFETIEVTVVAPAPENPTATPSGNNIILNWEPSPCSNASCYQIYRKIDSLGYTPDTCITGVPASTGYTLIATIPDATTTTYSDNNLTSGFDYGQQYCYMIVACFDDGAESYPTEEFCTELKRDVPVITRVSVNTTDIAIGSDTVTWSMPTELDTTVQWQGPYQYKIYRDNVGIGFTNVSTILAQTDTFFVDNNINTKDNQYTYHVELLSNSEEVGVSQTANSVYLTSTPTDKVLHLTWTENVPWTNEKYVVFRQNATTLQFEILDTVSTQMYSDSNLVNGVEYCYFVRSVGSYSANGFINPILNNSQEHCNIPFDDVAPCPPQEITIEANCDEFQTTMTWTNPNNVCADDVVGYYIYYAPNIGKPLEKIDSIRVSSDTTYTRINYLSIAGCYTVSAVDTFYNESLIEELYCVDNCPVYELPKVFTPGGDGYNDLFIPFPYRYIQDINLVIYNRWGKEVFKTTDKEINWDGINQFSGEKCTEGVYYYVCTVNEIRLQGIVSRQLKGYLHLIWEK